jgi:hypothetical protein
MKNEALRLLLAMTALILTALLTNPLSHSRDGEGTTIAHEIQHNESIRRNVAAEKATKKKPRASRTFAFFFKR